MLSPSKEKVSPDLKRALQHLNLRGLDALENVVLRQDAFLRPWADFRDGFLLIQPDGMPRAALQGQIDGPAILNFYTLYDEGTLRYEPLADETSSVYTADTSKHGHINKSNWTVVEYEKLLHAYLLQTFKVGKTKNPFGIQYFVLKNVCTAWREVFIPIVNAVRDSYDIKGRRHYGRLAKFIEDICPSRLAFPENNVGAQAGPTSPTPFRLVSMPKKRDGAAESGGITASKNRDGAKEYEEEEKELRHAYPQYGHLVERPRFIAPIRDWISEQKSRKEHAKALKELEGSPSRSVSMSQHRRSFSRVSNLLSRSSSVSVANRTYNMDSSEPQRSPLHGKTRIVETPPKKEPRDPVGYGYDRRFEPRVISNASMESSETAWPTMGHTKNDPDGVYHWIRSSNPFTDDTPKVLSTPPDRKRTGTTTLNESDRTANFQFRAIPKPLFSECDDSQGGRSKQSPRAGKAPATRIPSPVYPYEGHHRPTPNESTRPGNAPSTRKYYPIEDPRSMTYPTNEPPPPIPPKHPARINSIRGHVQGTRSAQLVTETSQQNVGPRIISKENIRAALGGLSRETSEESLQEVEHRTRRLGDEPLNTFNTHMFPRSPPQSQGARYRPGGQYEMEVLRRALEEDEA